MKRRSARMAALMRVYAKKRRAFLEANPLCAVGNDHAATECHHRRGRVGDLLLDESLWLPMCRDHHREVTERPLWAIEQGYSLPRIGRSA